MSLWSNFSKIWVSIRKEPHQILLPMKALQIKMLNPTLSLKCSNSFKTQVYGTICNPLGPRTWRIPIPTDAEQVLILIAIWKHQNQLPTLTLEFNVMDVAEVLLESDINAQFVLTSIYVKVARRKELTMKHTLY